MLNLGFIHLLRPWWLLLALPIIWYFWKKKETRTAWSQVVDKHLLPVMLAGNSKNPSKKWYQRFEPLFWALLICALVGPATYRDDAQESLQKNPLIILLEVSEHMMANDVNPTRLKRAAYKITDLLEKIDSPVALVAFAGDAHVVTPLTNDDATLKTLLDSLEPNMMPLKGVRLGPALKQAEALSMGTANSHIVVATSSNIDDLPMVKQELSRYGSRVSFWVFASSQGAPKTDPQGAFSRDHRGEVAISRLQNALSETALATNAYYLPFSHSDKDVLSIRSQMDHGGAVKQKSEKPFEQWVDQGPYYLIAAMLFFIPLALRATPWWLASLALVLVQPQESHAAGFVEWLQRPDQRGYNALKAGNYEAAAAQYEDPESKGASLLLAKKYPEAIEELKQTTTSDGQYNLGNAYAQAGKIDEAIKAYDEALKIDPKHQDALFNKALLEKLKSQQEPPPKSEENKQDKAKDESAQEPPKKDEAGNPEQKQAQDSANAKPQDKKGEQGQNDNQEHANSPSQPGEASKEPKDGQKTEQPPAQADAQPPKKDIPKGEPKENQSVKAVKPSEPLSPTEQYVLDQIPESHYLRRKFLNDSQLERGK
jgi:Ca-activated chloride channel family protein